MGKIFITLALTKYDMKCTGNQSKNKWENIKLEKSVHQGAHLQSEKANCRMGEIIYKSDIW